jgi:Dienelactone hydrolase family
MSSPDICVPPILVGQYAAQLRRLASGTTMAGPAKPNRRGVRMIESEVIITTRHGRMPTFVAGPEELGQYPGIIFYMDAPRIREELRNMARRIAKHRYVCLLPDMYYRLGTVRFDIPRRDARRRGRRSSVCGTGI